MAHWLHSWPARVVACLCQGPLIHSFKCTRAAPPDPNLMCNMTACQIELSALSSRVARLHAADLDASQLKEPSRRCIALTWPALAPHTAEAWQRMAAAATMTSPPERGHSAIMLRHNWRLWCSACALFALHKAYTSCQHHGASCSSSCSPAWAHLCPDDLHNACLDEQLGALRCTGSHHSCTVHAALLISRHRARLVAWLHGHIDPLHHLRVSAPALLSGMLNWQSTATHCALQAC